MLDKLFRTNLVRHEEPNSNADTLVSTPADASHPAPPGTPTHASQHTPDKRSGQVIACENEVNILHALNKFGWLTSRQLGEWVWPGGTQQAQMARRTLNRLKRLSQVLVFTLPNGVPAYALSSAGATRLGEHGIDARSGKDLRMGRWIHRALCNWHSITVRNVYGHDVYSEHELYTRRCPVGLWCGKVADSVQVRRTGFTWIEAEHSRRRPSDMRKLMHLLVHGPLNPIYAHDLKLKNIELITTDARLTDRIATVLTKELDSLPLTDQQRHLIRTQVYVSVLTMTPGLIVEDYPVWRDLLLGYA